MLKIWSWNACVTILLKIAFWDPLGTPLLQVMIPWDPHGAPLLQVMTATSVGYGDISATHSNPGKQLDLS